MARNEDGFWVEDEPCHGKDAERRFENESQWMADTIARLDRIMSHRRYRDDRWNLLQYRDGLIIQLHDHERIGRAYDARYAAALSDPTGQDLDAFYGDY